MLARRKIEEIISVLLLIGIFVSTALVLVGGILFLWQSGNENILALPLIHQSNLTEVWQFAFSFTPLGIIELGLLSLVMIQVLRVALLCGFYIITRDIWFTAISTFILCVLVYSIVWRH